MVRLAAIIIALPLMSIVYAQQRTPITSGGKVHITGENPGIRLLDKPGGTILTEVNFWGVDWSPAGTGHVCFLTTRNSAGQIDLRLALFDNPKLVDFVAKETMGKLVTNFNDPPYKAVKAVFTNTGDSVTERRQRCKSDEYDVELVWRDFNEGSWGEMRPPNGFHMTFFVITSRAAEIYINGKNRRVIGIHRVFRPLIWHTPRPGERKIQSEPDQSQRTSQVLFQSRCARLPFDLRLGGHSDI
jgi:hypothetical protein